VGLVDILIGARICLDTTPIIYFIEKDQRYLSIISPLFNEIEKGGIEAITSTITLLEVLTHPFRNDNEMLANKYRDILLNSNGLTTYEILHEVSEKAARLRANHSIKTPDAIQIAVGIIFGAEHFVTNDSNLKKIRDMNILILDDYL
jgi:predicted nucleic acid-binding protein